MEWGVEREQQGRMWPVGGASMFWNVKGKLSHCVTVVIPRGSSCFVSGSDDFVVICGFMLLFWKAPCFLPTSRNAFSSSFQRCPMPLTFFGMQWWKWRRQPMIWRTSPRRRRLSHPPSTVRLAARRKTKGFNVRRRMRRRRTAVWPPQRIAPPPTSPLHPLLPRYENRW